MTKIQNHTLPKTHAIIQILGDIDELSSIIGLSRCFCNNANVQYINAIQSQLFDLGDDISKIYKDNYKLKMSSKNTSEIEKIINDITYSIDIPRKFIKVGENKNKASAFLDYSRSVCRRVERDILGIIPSLSDKINEIDSQNILSWINILSKALWYMARLEDSLDS